MKLNITGIQGTITEAELSDLIYKALHKVDSRGDLTDIVMTAAQQQYIKHYTIYSTRGVSAALVDGKIVGSMANHSRPMIHGINVEISG